MGDCRNWAKTLMCRIQSECWKCRPVTASISDVDYAAECLTWALTPWATTQSLVQNGAQRLTWAAGLGCVLAAWGLCAMREDRTSPTCCGFSFQRGCCWTRSRRVQPEVSVEGTDSCSVGRSFDLIWLCISSQARFAKLSWKQYISTNYSISSMKQPRFFPP